MRKPRHCGFREPRYFVRHRLFFSCFVKKSYDTSRNACMQHVNFWLKIATSSGHSLLMGKATVPCFFASRLFQHWKQQTIVSSIKLRVVLRSLSLQNDNGQRTATAANAADTKFADCKTNSMGEVQQCLPIDCRQCIEMPRFDERASSPFSCTILSYTTTQL